MQINFTVPGRPVPMARPRVTARGTYTPKRCRDYKAAVAMCAKAAMQGQEPTENAVNVFVNIAFAVPKSWPKAKQKAALSFEIRPTVRPDLDNVYKAITDAMNGIVYKDDSQIVGCNVSKWYHRADFVEVSIVDKEAGQ